MAPAKVQAELDDVVVGRKRASTLAWARLPYTDAVLHKIQHFISMVAFGLPRALTCAATSCPRCPLSLGILQSGGRGGLISGSERSLLTDKGFLALASNWGLFLE